jgi:hypothetical protein
MLRGDFTTQQYHFPNNRMNLDRGFSGLFQGASGKTVLVKCSWSSGLTVAPLRSGISPNFVLSEAKDIIDILLPGPATGNGEGGCLLTTGGVTGSAASGFWWS